LHPRLADGLRSTYATHVGADTSAVAVEFSEIPHGRFFTAARLSRSSLVGGSVPAGTPASIRTPLMAAITSLWCDVTGCSPEDVVVSIADAPA
jgi:phenylpyruvate tautomerase PptA (4-oxalocrotonate tautomerase family)